MAWLRVGVEGDWMLMLRGVGGGGVDLGCLGKGGFCDWVGGFFGVFLAAGGRLSL